ncbi:MAG: hypothetical protein GXN92_01550, partial [Candidatus Micrarchaeota archaeon]|nr:hypothetical protein [Candidatus Micrarchaeota archaeon]
MEKLLPEQGKAVKEEQKINGPEAISSNLALVIKRVTTFPTRDTSQLPKIRIGQEEFGILSPEMRELGYKAIETGRIADCVGVIILDKKKGYYALAHLDPLTAPAVLQMLFRMREEGAEGPYEVHIVTSLQSSPEAVETIKNKLQLEAKQIIIHKVPQVRVNIGVDEEGNLYSPERIDINVSFAEGVSKILGSAAQRMAGQEPIIKYVNPQHKLEALSPSLDIHLPPDLVEWIKKNDSRLFVPVQARVHSAGEKYTSYILRLPFDAPPHLVEELLSNLKGEGKLKDVKVGINRKYKLV